jgi:uncharacterized protein YjbJ (UPF0337 family)
MNREQFKGMWHEFKGEVKKQWGKLTDDDLKQIEGDFEKFQGVMQKHYGDQKEKVWTDRWFKEHPSKSDTAKKAS